MCLNGLFYSFSKFVINVFSKLATLSLNLNTKEKSRREVNKVVASEVIGVGVGVACCGRGLKKGGGGGIVIVKLDVISGTDV
ncbi:hypothetical protein Tco_0062711, partial [Tanacetum coccineum]